MEIGKRVEFRFLNSICTHRVNPALSNVYKLPTDADDARSSYRPSRSQIPDIIIYVRDA